MPSWFCGVRWPGRGKRVRGTCRAVHFENLEPRELLAILTVTNTFDVGPGSLRQAMLDANAVTEPATIVFAIPATDPGFIDVDSLLAGGDSENVAFLIQPLGALPEINNPVAGITLDARTQSTITGDTNPLGPEIILEGNGQQMSGIVVASGDHTIAGFNIRRFSQAGIRIRGGDRNVVMGNYVGTQPRGDLATELNNGWGILVDEGAANNRIGTNGDGTDDVAERNLVSGNQLSGIGIRGVGSDNNVVAGNYVGTNAAGSAALANANRGIDLGAGAKGNRIGTNADGQHDLAEGNLISGNSWEGIGISGEGTTNNVVAGNLIGTDVTGKLDLGNAFRGIAIFNSASRNTIGGGGPARRNIISGNDSGGINITSSAFENHVSGNFVGTDDSGTLALANIGAGVRMGVGAHHNTIGTNADGTGDELEGNLISANTSYGVHVTGANNANNVIAGNLIGTDHTGIADLGNSQRGIAIEDGARDVTVGGTVPSARNVISGNGTGGIRITPVTGGATTNVVIIGNYIGTSSAGNAAVTNNGFGVLIESGAGGNRIGTDGDGLHDAVEGNLISGNNNSGVRIIGGVNNVVAGNLIGLNAAGSVALTNAGNGVSLGQGATGNRIGTNGDGVSDELERNVISGNTNRGIRLTDEGTAGNVVAGNFLGTNATGTVPIGNFSDGIGIELGAKANRVGTDGNGKGDAAERNIIAGNGGAGINLLDPGTSLNVIAGNTIGTNAADTTDLGNILDGIRLQNGAHDNKIGGPGALANTIAFNKRNGVALFASAGTGNAIAGNSIFSNGLLGIDLGDDGLTPNDVEDADAGPNRGQNWPTLAPVLIGRSLTVDYTLHTAPEHAAYPITIELYVADAAGQEGQTLLRTIVHTTLDAALPRRLSFVPSVAIDGEMRIVGTATDAAGNTSEFSWAAVVEDRPNPWHNFALALDVNGNGKVQASDALAVINYVNAFGPRFVPIEGPAGPDYYDASNDGQVSALDVLTIINAINAGFASAEEEPEVTADQTANRALAGDLLMALWSEPNLRPAKSRKMG
jgi:hypothetical protein